MQQHSENGHMTNSICNKQLLSRSDWL